MKNITNDSNVSNKHVVYIQKFSSGLIAAFAISLVMLISGTILVFVNFDSNIVEKIFGKYTINIFYVLTLFPLFTLRFIVPALGLHSIMLFFSKWNNINQIINDKSDEKRIKAIALRYMIIVFILSVIPLINITYCINFNVGMWNDRYILIHWSIIISLIGIVAGGISFWLYGNTSAKFYGRALSVISVLLASSVATLLFIALIWGKLYWSFSLFKLHRS